MLLPLTPLKLLALVCLAFEFSEKQIVIFKKKMIFQYAERKIYVAFLSGLTLALQRFLKPVKAMPFPLKNGTNSK